jgi:hypothetical protein
VESQYCVVPQFAAVVQIVMPIPLGKASWQQYWPVGQSAVAAQFWPKKVQVEVALAGHVSSRSAFEL